MAQQTLDFVIAQQVTGQADVARLIKSVGALDAEMQKLRSASASMSGGFNQAANAIRGNTNVLDAQSKALRNQRMGLQQAGMQINDFATSVSTGASPVQAFNQQIGQLGYAMSMMQGRTAAVGRFLAGPWSIAVIGAAMILGPMIEGLFEVEKKQEDVEAASYALGTAENILATVFDLTTGKIKEQNPILVANARLKLQLAKIDAQRQEAEGRAELVAIRRGRLELQGSMGGLGGVRRVGDRTQDIVDRFQKGINNSTFALAQLQNRLEAGLINEEEYTKAAVAIDKIAVAGENLKVFAEAQDVFDGSTKALQGFLKPQKESNREADKLGKARERELQQAEAIAEKIRDMGLVYGASNKQIGETAKKLDDFNDMVARLKGLTGGPALVEELAATIAMVGQAIEGEGAAKALADFNAEVDKLTKKDLTPFEQSIAGLNAARANQGLMLDPESGQRYYEGLSAAARPFFNDAIKGQQDLIDKAMGVDNAFQMQVASLQQIIATMQAAGAPTEELQGQLAKFISMQDELKLAEKNAEIKNSFEAVGQAAANAFKGMITGAQSFGDAMKGIIQAVIDELFRLFVVQQIVGMVSSAFSGAFGGASPSGSNSGVGAALGLDARGGAAGATGGYPAPGKPVMVGERGPELFVPTGSGKIIPNHQMGGGGGMVINVDARGATSPEMVRQQVQQGILEAAPSIVAAAEQRTISTLRRPRLAGVM